MFRMCDFKKRVKTIDDEEVRQKAIDDGKTKDGKLPKATTGKQDRKSLNAPTRKQDRKPPTGATRKKDEE